MKALFVLLCLAPLAAIRADEVPAKRIPVQPAAVDRWRDARFGLFLHWGPVSLTGKELSWSRGYSTPIDEYDALYKKFNPEKFDADAWAALAKAAGVKYVILTNKHHDGFFMWDTKLSDYSITHTPFQRDVTRELADACRKQGLFFGAYCSVCDWHDPDFPMGGAGGKIPNPHPDMEKYTEFLKGQVTELLTGYGPLFTLWFDGPQCFDPVRGQDLIDMARRLQPDIMVNDRTKARGDYDTPEQKIGGFDTTRPWETCMTMGTSWSWQPNDKIKTLSECLQSLIRANGGDGNFLLDVGPEPTGEIEPRQAAVLRGMGDWLKQYGESVYGTRGGPYHPTDAYAATRRDDAVYIHVFQWNGDTLSLPPLQAEVVASSLLGGGQVTVDNGPDALKLHVAPADQKEIDTVVKLTVKGLAPLPSFQSAEVPVTAQAGEITATASDVFEDNPSYGPDKAADGKPDTRWATNSGLTSAWIILEFKEPRTVSHVMIQEAIQARAKKFTLAYEADNLWGQWETILSGDSLGGPDHPFNQSFPSVTGKRFRLEIEEATDGPTLSEVRLDNTPKK